MARRGQHKARDPASFLNLFEHKLRQQRKLSPQEVSAVVAFLSMNVDELAELRGSEQARGVLILLRAS